MRFWHDDDIDWDNLTDEQYEYYSDRYEYLDEWLESRDELYGVSLEEYDEMKRIEDYGMTDDELDCGDDD